MEKKGIQKVEYIIIIGIFQALVAAGLLWKSKLRNSSDGLLIAFMCCIALHLSIKFVIFHLIADEQVHLTMNTFINFCYAPLLYLYTKKVIDPGFQVAAKWFIFLPFLFAVVGYFSVVGVMMAGIDQQYKELNLYNQATFWSLMPFDLFLFMGTHRLARRKLSLQLQERQLIVQLSYLFVFIIIIALGFYTLRLFGHSYNLLARSISYATLIIISLRIIRFRYVAFQSDPGIATVQIVPAGEDSATESPAREIKKTRLNEEEMHLVWEKLEAVMQHDKAYTDSELNLDKLALMVRENKYHISETLNAHAGTTF